MAKRTKARSTPLRCYPVPGTTGRYCVMADVAKAAGTSRQALSDAVKKGRLNALVVATLKLIPQTQAKAYVKAAKRRGLIRLPRRKP